MNDATTTIEELKALVREFVAERDWEKFHAPKNLSMALAIEVAELMEHFQWISMEDSRELSREGPDREPIVEELADVLGYTLALSLALEVDLATAVREKMKKNALKYPAEKYRGHYERPRKADRGEDSP